jgi:nucleosome binding factor SPN SPT16 subunit
MTPTSKTLEAMYLMLCQMKPFNTWDLPNTALINFVVTSEEDSYGTYVFDDDIHIITISKAKCSHFETILKTLSHELIHLKRYKSKNWDKHDKIFRKYAAQIADEFGWDRLEL